MSDESVWSLTFRPERPAGSVCGDVSPRPSLGLGNVPCCSHDVRCHVISPSF